MAVGAEGRPFVGRVEAVEALHRRFEDARAGSGGVTLLVGDTGVGKSRLVADLARDMRARGVQVLEGRAPPVDAPPPFSLLRAALESARTSHDGPEPVERSVPDGILIGFAPGLGDAGPRGPVRVEERLLAALGEADERTGGLRDPVWTALAEQFLGFTRRGPTALILEDLQRADDRSLEAVEFLARQLQNRPLWILATVRPYGSLPPGRRARLEAFENATEARRIPLRPLTSGEVATFLKSREPGRRFTDEEIARRFSETGGNPLLLEQLDRRRAPGPARRAGRNLPAGTDPAEDRALDVAAVVGPEVSFAVLLAASGDEEEALAETVDRLVGRGLLLERPGELLTFADERERETRYARLTQSRRRLLHRRVGEAIEATGAADVDTIYALARHFYFGRVDERSIRYNRAAAEIAERAFSPETAKESLGRALESHRRAHPDDWATETELVLELAEQTDHAGELKSAEAMLRKYLERKGLAERIPPASLALAELYLAQIQTDRGDWKAAEEATARLLRTTPSSASTALRIGLYRLRGESLYYLGRYEEALAEHSEELRLARSTGNPRAAALGQSRRANVLAMMGRAAEALREGRETAATLEELGDLREASHAHLFLGVVLAGVSRPERRPEAIAEFEEAIRLAETAHDLRRVGWALFNAADILRQEGALDRASDENHRAREILERIGDRFGLVQSMIVSGKIALDRGEFDRSEADLLEAYRLVRELRAPADEVDVVLRLAQLSYARGDRASARRRVRDLERQNLPALRPDVVPDFERLKHALAREDEESDAAGR
jgi:predicted ATPase